MHQVTGFKKAFFQRTRAAFAHRAGRFATFGLAAVLIVLSIFALWGEFSTNRAANAGKRSSELSDAFEQARFAVAAEESLNRKYRLQPSAEVLAQHHKAAAALQAAMERARELGRAPFARLATAGFLPIGFPVRCAGSARARDHPSRDLR